MLLTSPPSCLRRYLRFLCSPAGDCRFFIRPTPSSPLFFHDFPLLFFHDFPLSFSFEVSRGASRFSVRSYFCISRSLCSSSLSGFFSLRITSSFLFRDSRASYFAYDISSLPCQKNPRLFRPFLHARKWSLSDSPLVCVGLVNRSTHQMRLNAKNVHHPNMAFTPFCLRDGLVPLQKLPFLPSPSLLAASVPSVRCLLPVRRYSSPPLPCSSLFRAPVPV